MKAHVLLPALASALVLAGDAAGAGSWPIEILERPAGKPVKRVVLVAQQPGARVTSLLFARAAGPTSLSGVAVLSGPLSKQGVRVSIGGIEIRADGEAVPADGVAIPARPALVALSLSVTAPSVAGVYRGRVYGIRGGRARFLFTLVLRVEPLLELVGVEADGIKLERRAAGLAQTVRVRSEAVRGFVRFEASPLSTPNSTQEAIDLTVDGQKPAPRGVWFSPNQTRALELKATTPLAGSYTGHLTITWRGFRRVVPISIVRTREAPTIEVLNVSRIHEEADFYPSWTDGPWEDFEVSFTALLHETAGDVFVAGVTVPKLVRVEGESEVAEDLADVEAVGASGKPGPFEIGNDSHVEVRINLGKLGPGSYSGIIRAQVAGAPAVDTPFVLTVRRSWLLAAALIALGMLTALALRKSFGGRERSLRRHVGLKRLRREVLKAEEEAFDSTEASLFAQVRTTLESIASGAFSETEPARIARLRRRLDLAVRWREARRALPDGEPFDAARQELTDIGNRLAADREPRRKVELDLDRISQRLNAVNDDIRKLLVEQQIADEVRLPQWRDVAHQARIRSLQRELDPLDRWVLSRFLRLRDWLTFRTLATIIVFVGSWLALVTVAVVLGLKLLWEGEPTWGDFGDCIAAFLWGAGLQQVGGVTFQGLLGLSEKVGAPPAPAPS